MSGSERGPPRPSPIPVLATSGAVKTSPKEREEAKHPPKVSEVPRRPEYPLHSRASPTGRGGFWEFAPLRCAHACLRRRGLRVPNAPLSCQARSRASVLRGEYRTGNAWVRNEPKALIQKSVVSFLPVSGLAWVRESFCG